MLNDVMQEAGLAVILARPSLELQLKLLEVFPRASGGGPGALPGLKGRDRLLGSGGRDRGSLSWGNPARTGSLMRELLEQWRCTAAGGLESRALGTSARTSHTAS